MPDKPIRRLVSRLQFLANEHGTYLSVQEVADTVGQVSLQLFNSLLFPKQPVKAGRTFGPGYNRAVDSRLAPFKRTQAYTADPNAANGDTLRYMPGGVLELPAGSAYVSKYAVPGAVQVEEVSDHALDQRLACEITGPTATHPLVAEVDHGRKQLYPAGLTRCEVVCYVTPPTPVYALSDPADENSYDDENSVDTGWKEDAEPELIARALTLLGIPLRDPALQQAGIAHTQQDL